MQPIILMFRIMHFSYKKIEKGLEFASALMRSGIGMLN